MLLLHRVSNAAYKTNCQIEKIPRKHWNGANTLYRLCFRFKSEILIFLFRLNSVSQMFPTVRAIKSVVSKKEILICSFCWKHCPENTRISNRNNWHKFYTHQNGSPWGWGSLEHLPLQKFLYSRIHCWHCKFYAINLFAQEIIVYPREHTPKYLPLFVNWNL